jgi:hypothetical protein
MTGDFTVFLWLLKLGALVNLYFLANTLAMPAKAMDPHILVPAQILFAVSAYRCLFPVQYKGNVVFHDSVLSSVFLTRLLATASEVAYIYLLSLVIRRLNAERVEWVNALSWLMVLQVVISQGFVWAAILTGRLMLYFYEELGWAIIFTANAIACAYLDWTLDAPGEARILLRLSMLFGLVYLPFQFVHLRLQISDARRGRDAAKPGMRIALREGLERSILERNRTSDATKWGGLVGLLWMTGYWATLIPMWVNQAVVAFSNGGLRGAG